MKSLFLLLSLCFCASGFAQNDSGKSPFMSVKERLRIVLWTEGVSDPLLHKLPEHRARVPEELQKALAKFEAM
jgi:hypothetical protein